MSEEDSKDADVAVTGGESENTPPARKRVTRKTAPRRKSASAEDEAGGSASENPRTAPHPAEASNGGEKDDARRDESGDGGQGRREGKGGGPGGSPGGDRPNWQGGGGGNKFNRNKKRGKKQRDHRRGGRPMRREEESPIELGDMPEDPLFESLENLASRASEVDKGGGEPLDFVRIYGLPLPELREEVARAGVETTHAPSREQLINALVRGAAEAGRAILTEGVLEPLDDEEGALLVYERDNYRVKALSAYVPQIFVKHYGLQRGHIVRALLHPHREGETCPFVLRIDTVMGRDPETLPEIVPFTERVPYYPLDRILLESEGASKWDNLSMRVVDCLSPVGFGQRGLIVAPPRTGKTMILQGMANSIQTNYPEAHLIVLLVDERPEEVTDFRRQVQGEVISSTFDEAAESHVHAAEMVIEKARRMVEVGRDVIILLDSITRLARAYNTMMPNSGKILSGGVEANALQKPKRFFGSARNIEDGGSLTIIATALVETGSKMDEVIFEEFKGTGNMELHLDRALSDKRIYPALSMDRSGTRKEELLYHPDEMQKIYSLRRAMKGLPSSDAMEMLIQRVKKTKTNAEFLMSVAR